MAISIPGDLLPVMNDTKWEELREAMHGVEPPPKWRTMDIESSYVSHWDGEWFYHFRQGGYACIEWVEIRFQDEQHRHEILRRLASIHVPGEALADAFRVYGYVRRGAHVDYLG